MFEYTSDFGGSATLRSSVMTGPFGSFARACSMMRMLWRISSMRTR